MSDEKNLVALIFGENNHYIKVVKPEEIQDKKFSLDSKNEVWSYRNSLKKWQNISIGNARPNIGLHDGEYHQGIIGVYDITKFDHIQSIVNDSIIATDRLSPGWAVNGD